MRDFLRLSINVPDGVPRPPDDMVDTDPVLRRYWEDFGDDAGDVAFAAVGQSGQVIGIASARILGGDNPGYGHLDDETPEVDVSDRPEWRGRRVGTALMRALLSRLHEVGYQQTSFSVDKGNAGARRLYERLGFRAVVGDDDQNRTEVIMVNHLGV